MWIRTSGYYWPHYVERTLEDPCTAAQLLYTYAVYLLCHMLRSIWKVDDCMTTKRPIVCCIQTLKKAKTLFLLFSGRRLNVIPNSVSEYISYIGMTYCNFRIYISFSLPFFTKICVCIFLKKKKVLNRTKRSVCVNVSPVASMVSFRFLAWGPFRRRHNIC